MSRDLTPPAFLAVEISRATGLSPISIINALAKEGSLVSPDESESRIIKEWQTEIKTPQPSKKADKFRSLVLGERQRYERSFQFPKRGPKTTRNKIDSRTVLYQAERAKISLRKTKLVEELTKQKGKESPSQKGLSVARSSQPEISEQNIKDVLESSLYWTQGKRQLITPDVLLVDRDSHDILDVIPAVAY